ncbi:MAG: Efflux transporter, outer rane factor lipoprotein NodT family [Ferruginibacter sp.]|nr:Efflux transporter, outer rane factor lipoprotein NodT family [Ferruginibacter sp.]
MKKRPIIYFLLSLTIIATSCSVTKPYKPPIVGKQDLYRDQSLTDTINMVNLHWTEIFGDTLLENIIQEGIDNNLDLKIAYSRIIQAQAYFDQSRLAFIPGLSADVSTLNGKQSNNNNTTSSTSVHLYQLNVNASWEADLWGKLKSSKRAALASLLQSAAYSRTVQTKLVANIANYYYNLVALDQELKITEESVKNWISTVNIMKALKEANVVTEAAVVQSEASRYAAEVTIPDLKQLIKQTENALSIQLGRKPGQIIRGKLSEQEPGNLLHTGIPAQLLSNRPDVQEAELNLRYNFELTNIARTYFYPTLVISASGGFSGSSVSNLFNPTSLIGSIAAGLVQPLFNHGINKARLKVAQEAQKQALLTFQNIVLTAGQEVSDDMVSYQSTIEKTSLRDSQIVNLQKAVEYTQLLVRYSSANYTEVLNAQQSLLSAQLNQVNDRLQQLQAILNLYHDLGGGWK